ncbi:MAG TPA: hypothetical protein VNB29_04500 [Chthoniobacterales bacterium]|nr:hypothetical protein [Chthoniobacterales bacterium]
MSGPLLGQLTATDFEPLLDDSFLLLHQNIEIPLTLVEIRPSASKPPAGLRPPFSILFRSLPGPALPQGSYWISSEKLGRMELFIVPIRTDGDGSYYEAVFG